MSLYRHNPDSLARVLTFFVLLGPAAYGLPEDENMPLEIEANYNEIYLDRGYSVYRGSEDEPAIATRGSMRISGQEIVVEREAGVIARVTARGSATTPARFQQQPAVDQAIVHASGAILLFDNQARLVTADGDAEFSQAGNTLNGQHIEYNLDTRFASASGGDTSERVRMYIPPLAE